MTIARHANPDNWDVEIKVVGSQPEHKPYIRLAHIDPDGVEVSSGYLGAISHATAMRALANQILRALDGE